MEHKRSNVRKTMEKVEAYMARFEMGNDPIELDKVVAIPTMVAKDHNGKPLCLDKKTTVGFYHHFFFKFKGLFTS